MKRIEIFDPAMCCPTGLCGPNINPDLMRIAAVLETLKRQGIVVERHNLRDEPQLYVSNKTVNDYLMKEGAEGLPITIVEGEIVVTKGYPTNKQLSEWTGIQLDIIPIIKNDIIVFFFFGFIGDKIRKLIERCNLHRARSG